jgi:hypothetical protein
MLLLFQVVTVPLGDDDIFLGFDQGVVASLPGFFRIETFGIVFPIKGAVFH